MSDSPAREWRFYLNDMISFAEANVPEEVRHQYPQTPWRMVVATRNKLIHGYLGIDNDTLWSIIKTDVPALLVELHKMKKAYSH